MCYFFSIYFIFFLNIYWFFLFCFFFFKHKTAYEMRISDWSSDVCSSDLDAPIEIAIMVCPQAGASTIYGMYDMLAGAGRDWETVIEGTPTEGRLRPRILSRDGVPMVVGNGVTVTPDGRFEDCLAPDVVVVPELRDRQSTRLNSR